jgi:hypothetical protein
MNSKSKMAIDKEEKDTINKPEHITKLRRQQSNMLIAFQNY